MEHNFSNIVEDVLKKYNIQTSNEEHIKNTIDVMSQNLDTQENPKVGIFWYDVRTKTLFGVVAIDKDSLNNLMQKRFELAKKSFDVVFRGSTNQRILDVKKSLEKKKAVKIAKYK